MTPAQRIAELRLALMMLTRLPAGTIKGSAPSLAQAAWAFPLVGLLVGGLGWLVFAGALAAGAPALVAAGLAIASAVVVTGGLHYDGLADFADGIGGGRDKAHSLEIMRDSRIGSYGVVALILAMGLQAAALAEGATLWAFLAIGVGSRVAMTAVLVTLPAARTDGLGQMAAQPPVVALLPGGVVLCLVALPIGPAAVWPLIAMALTALAVGAMAHRRIQGQTGDVLGATQLVAEVAAWCAWSAVVLA